MSADGALGPAGAQDLANRIATAIAGETLQTSGTRSGAVPTPIYKFLTLDNDGSTIEATGNYALAAESFYIQPPAGEIWRINRMIIYLQDNGNLGQDGYGSGSALTNGISVQHSTDNGLTILTDLTDSQTIKINPHWSRVNYDVNIYNYTGGDGTLGSRWTFANNGYPIRLVGDNNDRFQVIVNDDLSGLLAHSFFIGGYKE